MNRAARSSAVVVATVVSAVAGTGTAAAADVPTCDPGRVVVTAEGGLAAAGHVGFRLHLVNATARPCTTGGYPRVVLLDASGHRVQTATPTPRGYLGGQRTGNRPPSVTLRTGEEATALVEGTDVDDPSTCDTAVTVRSTLPRTTGPVATSIEPDGFFACAGVTVHPLLPGDTGSS